MKKNPYLFKEFRGGIDDVFYNTFDRTWAKVAPDQPELPRTLTKLPIEAADDDGTVVYNYNFDFFRSDEFTTSHKQGAHILFAGCSQTEGVGAPLESVWSKVLSNKLGSDLGFYSIAKSGFGWQKIITSFMIYVDSYGAPDYLFALLPNLGRFFVWDDRSGSFSYVQRYPNGGEVSTEQEDLSKIAPETFIEKPFSNDEHKRSFVDFSISWKLFEKYCEAIGTKILWASWDYTENKNYELARISNNYISLDEDKQFEYVRSQRPYGQMQEFDLFRRDGHAGVLINEYWATEFEKEIKNRAWL